MNKNILLSSLILVLLITIQVSSFNIDQDVFNGYRHLLTTGRGNDSILYNVEISGTNICLASKISDGSVIKGIKYNYPTDINVRDEDDKISYTPTRDGSNKYCINIVNPLITTFLKFGENSIIIEGDVSYNSTDQNITQETGSAHLEIQDTNLRFYLPFYLNEFGIVHEMTTNNFDGTLNGNLTFVPQGGAPDMLGSAYAFDGIDDYIDMGDVLNPGTGNFTIAVWVNFTDISPSNQKVFQKRGISTSSGEPGWSIGVKNPTDIDSFFEDTDGDFIQFGGIPLISTTSNPAIQDEWIFIVATRVGSNFTVYSNGTIIDSQVNALIGNISTTNHLTIGAGWTTPPNTTALHTNGVIDEPMFFDFGMTPTQVGKLLDHTRALFFNNGEMLFQNQVISTVNDTLANFSLTAEDSPATTQMFVKINNGPLEQLTNGIFNDYNLTGLGDMSNANFTLVFDGNDFFTPSVQGNISILTSGAPPDISPPVITNVNATDITQTLANITWDTDELSNSSVNFGTTTSLGTFAGQDDSVTSHLVSLSGLTDDTLFFFNLTSCDPSGNCATSGPFNFTTLIIIPNATLLGSVTINDLTAPKGQPLDLKAVCLDSTSGFCNLGTNCSLTLFDPTLNIVVNNERMSFNPTFFNFTLNENQTLVLGDHSGTIVCEGIDIVTNTFILTISPSGAGPLTTGQAFVLFGVLSIIIIIAVLFLIGGFKTPQILGKVFLFSFGAITVLIAILYSLLILNEAVAQSPILVEGFETFYFVMKILGTVGILALIVILFLVLFKAFKIRRGLIDK